jgi:hypothetical protein
MKIGISSAGKEMNMVLPTFRDPQPMEDVITQNDEIEQKILEDLNI